MGGREAENLTRCFEQKASVVMGEIVGACPMTQAALKQELDELKTFSSALRQQVSSLDADAPRDPCWAALRATLVSLLRSVDEHMAMTETFLERRAHGAAAASSNWMVSRPCVRAVMAELDAWSDVGEWPEIRTGLRATLAEHQAATRALVRGAGRSGVRPWDGLLGTGTSSTSTRGGTWVSVSHCCQRWPLPGSETRRTGFSLTGRGCWLTRSGALPMRRRRSSVPVWRWSSGMRWVRREWFCMVFQALFSPTQVLFSACPSDRRRFFINPISVVDPLHLPYYEFAGRMVALALMHEIPVGVSFDRTLFLQLANRSITLDDIADADPSLYASCKRILEMDASLVDSSSLGLSFIREVLLGSRTVEELIPGGKDTVVNSKNLHEYVHLLIQDIFVNCTTNQVAYLARGFSIMLGKYEVSKNLFDVLDVEDFNRMLGGSKDVIDMNEWKAHTDYVGYRRKSRQVKWFWEAVKAMTIDQQRRLLFFWTSVEYLPFDGFPGLGSRLSIIKSLNSSDHLPTSGTCFYKLNIPAYVSFDMMQRRLQMIVQEHIGCSFGKS